ncbi:head protein [Mycobacterium phage Indlulamithi]|uniref:Minor tail protein n=1 Tax=Mycobacterium phage Indlulamithi TaxID=2656582 RepID=A0A649VCK3_9CAUD|nr:head protein [Mycobacterium phage Indlulamithi]QGJ90071.1 hypothetical protein PBI_INDLULAMITHI_30 [Mycobacterium phage Indlulamithi]
MGWPVGTKNQTLTYLAGLGNWISLHTADPGTTGASEATGGSYARKQTAWGAAASALITGSQVSFTGLIAAAYTYFGVWTASTAGTFLYGFALSPGATLNGSGGFNVTPSIPWP